MHLEGHLDLGEAKLSHHNFLTETSDYMGSVFFSVHINCVICHRFIEWDV